MATGALLRREFRAMGTDIALAVPDGPGAARKLEQAERWVHAFEGRFSRFLPTSELSRLNAADGKPVRVSPMMFEFLRLSLDLAERSGGIFDPTVLRPLEAAGYDRTFDEIRGGTRAARTGSTCGGFRDVRLDGRRRTVTLPAGVGIDSGGLGKGFAADRAASFLGDCCLVDCGGDIRLRGRPQGRRAWQIAVEDPFDPARDIAALAVSDGAVATSSVLKRRWPVADGWAHHLIDTRKGGPAQGSVAAVTVVAPTATLADYHAKVALLLDIGEGYAYLEREADVEGLIVTRDREVIATAGLERYRWGRP